MKSRTLPSPIIVHNADRRLKKAVGTCRAAQATEQAAWRTFLDRGGVRGPRADRLEFRAMFYSNQARMFERRMVALMERAQ